MITTLKEHEPMFLRHVQPVNQNWELSRTDADIEHLKAWLREAIIVRAYWFR